MEVTVDLDDLKTLVFAASVVKQIEGALASFKRDPFVQPHLNFMPALKRMETAMRNAERAHAGTLVNFDEPLSPAEKEALYEVEGSTDISLHEKGKLLPGESMSVIDRLIAKGCIEIGKIVHGVVWAGEDAAHLTADPELYRARLTPRGRQKLSELGRKAS